LIEEAIPGAGLGSTGTIMFILSVVFLLGFVLLQLTGLALVFL
jgi:hypothetical protein